MTEERGKAPQSWSVWKHPSQPRRCRTGCSPPQNGQKKRFFRQRMATRGTEDGRVRRRRCLMEKGGLFTGEARRLGHGRNQPKRLPPAGTFNLHHQRPREKQKLLYFRGSQAGGEARRRKRLEGRWSRPSVLEQTTESIFPTFTVLLGRTNAHALARHLLIKMRRLGLLSEAEEDVWMMSKGLCCCLQ